MFKFAITAFILFFLSCAATHTQSDFLQLQKNISSIFEGELSSFKATGDILFSLGGEKHRGKLVQAMDDNMNYRCYFYTPFAQMVASIESDRDSATIVVGEQEYRIGNHEKIHIIPYFTIFPFSFSEFVRIISGRTIKNDIINHQRPVEKRAKKQIVAEWNSDSLTIALTYLKRNKHIDNVAYSPTHDDRWRLVLSSFKNGMFREFSFESTRGDFFNLTLKKVEYQ